MEGLAPPMKCLIEMQSALQNGEPARVGAQRYIQSANSHDELAMTLKSVLFAWDQGQDWRKHLTASMSPQRRALTELLVCGLSGQAVLPHLEELRSEIALACDLEIKRFTESLPLKMLVPLLLFQFPAFLILLFGPLLTRFVQELNR